jgi:glycosyltransferase involved in cell wall biosynthesis
LRSLLGHWRDKAADTFVLYFNGPGPKDPILDHPAVTSRPVGVGRKRGIVWQEWPLPEAARHDELDVFFAPAYSCPLRMRTPRVTTIHDLSFFSWPADFTARDAFRRRALVAASIQASARIVAVSDFTRREILTRFPAAAGRVVVVGEGPDDDLPSPPSREAARERLRLTGQLILSVGSLLNRRRAPVLLEALRRLAHLTPAPRLDIVGENRTHPRLDLGKAAADLGLEHRVRISGFVDEVGLADRYAAADVFVYLSEYEGFGLPVLEAMARGVPVITSTRPATGEIFKDAALLVEPTDSAAVAGAIERVLSSRTLADDLITRGRALAARHSWSDAAARTHDLLREAAGK